MSTSQYPLYVHWYKTLDWLLDKSEKMPRHVRFTVSSRVAGLALDIQESIIDAIYTRDRQPILRKINLQLEKLRVLLRICFERRYISEQQYVYIAEEIEKAGRMVGGWKNASVIDSGSKPSLSGT